MAYDRDLIGYANTPPDPEWPGGARLALQIVLNYDEGGERSVLHGDAESEAFLQEVVGMAPLQGVRNLQVESMYEYGSRVGFWRLMLLFAERGITISVFAVGMALERHPAAARAIVEGGHEVVSHGYRWIDYQFIDEVTEREHIHLAVESLTRHRQPPARLVHGATLAQHAAARRRRGRLPLRRRRLQRRPPLLGGGERPPAPRRPLHPRQQRHEVRDPEGASTAASSSSPTCVTPSTCSTPRARGHPG